LLKSYRVSVVKGDRYGGEWPRERFSEYKIEYRVSDAPKSDIYRDLLPLLNSGKCELLDNKRLVAQLCNLERRTARGGRDSIDHMPGTHDDLANAVAGALVLAAKRSAQKPTSPGVCPVIIPALGVDCMGQPMVPLRQLAGSRW